MAQKFPKKYQCTATGFVFWKGEKVRKGQVIEVSDSDWKNKGLRAKLAANFRPLAVTKVESGSVKIKE